MAFDASPETCIRALPHRCACDTTLYVWMFSRQQFFRVSRLALVAGIVFLTAFELPFGTSRMAPDLTGLLRTEDAVNQDRLCWTIPLSDGLNPVSRLLWRLPNQRSDGRAGVEISTLDGLRLGPADALHVDIATLGGGRFSVWNGHALLSMPEDSGTVELRWKGKAAVRDWVSITAALLSLFALILTIMVFRGAASDTNKGRASAFGFSLAFAVGGAICWTLLWQPSVNSTDTACLFMWPQSMMGHWPAVPCAIADVVCGAADVEYRAVVWIALDILAFSIALALCASLLKRRIAQVLCLAFVFLVPIVPSIALGVAVDSGAVSAGLLVAFSLCLLGEQGLDRKSACALAITMVALVSTRHIGAALLCGAPLLIVLRAQPSLRIRALASGCAVLMVAFVFATQLQLAVCATNAMQYQARPGRAAANCLSRVLYSAACMGVSEEEMIQALGAPHQTDAGRFVIRQAASTAASACAAWKQKTARESLSMTERTDVSSDATKGLWDGQPGGDWGNIVTGGGFDPNELEDAALLAYRDAALAYPIAWWRAFEFWSSRCLVPQWASARDIAKGRDRIELILAQEVYSPIHPAFARISRPAARNGPEWIPGGAAICAFLATAAAALVSVRFRKIAPTAIYLSTCIGLAVYVLGSVAMILVWKLNYSAPAVAVCAGILGITIGRAIDAWLVARSERKMRCVSNGRRCGRNDSRRSRAWMKFG